VTCILRTRAHKPSSWMRRSGKVLSSCYKADRVDQDVTAKLAELELVVADLTRANERVATVERRNVSDVRFRADRQEMLRSEIESARSGSQHIER
jgi:homeobox protein cut-like